MGKHIIKESQLRQIVEESVRTYLMESMVNEDSANELFDGAKAFISPFAKKIKEKGEEAYNAVADKGRKAYNAVADKVGDFAQGVQDVYTDAKENYKTQQQATQMQRTADKGQKMVEKTIQQLENIRTHYNVQKEDKYAISRAITALKRIMNNAFEAAKNKQAEVK